jgi:hypothetical protein
MTFRRTREAFELSMAGRRFGLAILLVSLSCSHDSKLAPGADGQAGMTGLGGGSPNAGSPSSAGASGATAGRPGTSNATGGSNGTGGRDSSAGESSGGTVNNEPVPPCVPDESAPVPERTLPGLWQKIELPGTVCGNGSQYKFFVNYSSTSNNLMVNLEPGGACWDYGSCAGDGGLRGAANPDGIGDNHMSMLKWEFLPLNRRDSTNPIGDWNMVFLPYCTGDLHTGNREASYENPEPNAEPLRFHHRGHDNVMRVIEWLRLMFPKVPRLLVTGCSAGGTGSLVNYHFFRKGLPGAQCSYLLDDSGPIFPSQGNSGPLHEKVRESWNLDPLIERVSADFPGVEAGALKEDLGLISTALADRYPQDRLALVLYRLDFNYTLYSYERFYNYPPQADLHRMWWEDIQLMMKEYDTRRNLAYFIPYYRGDNCSHCLMIPPVDSGIVSILAEPYRGTEIQERNVDARDFVEHLLNDSQELQSYVESVQPGESLSAERAAECQGL